MVPSQAVVPPRLSFVTIGVRDLPKMAAFYRSLGWPESETNNEHHIAFQLGGAVLALYRAEPYERELGPAPEAGAWKGVTFALNLESPERVDDVYAELERLGVPLDGPPEDNERIGLRGFSFRDPENNVWEVIWKPGTSFDERGGLIFP